jgi:hypothetical protein
MGKHHFILKSNDKKHKCYLDEDGRVYILDDNGTPIVVSAPTGIKHIEEAKEAAGRLLETLPKKGKSKV